MNTTTEFVPRRVRRLITALVIGLSAVVAMAAPAHAFVEPIEPASGVAPVSNDAPAGLTSGTSLAIIAATVVITLLAVAVVIMATRFARQRRQARPTGSSSRQRPEGVPVMASGH